MTKEHLLRVGTALSLACLVLFTLVGAAFAEVEELTLEELIGKASTILRGSRS